uniref:Uncharacterized protein n=1 Tax=Rhizophora mucronata TaxID=61149 RepID=A0A2P2QZC3_RHIMU
MLASENTHTIGIKKLKERMTGRKKGKSSP